MTLYSFALFVHIVGSLLLFTAFTAEGIGLFHLRKVTTREQARQWEGVVALARIFGPASVVTILVPGLYMMVTTWGFVSWLAVALFAWFAVAVMGAVNGIRLSLVMRRPATDVTVIGRLRAREFVVSWMTRLWIALGIVFLMTNKPDLAGALVCVAAAVVVGGSTGLVASRQ
jgi:hypothetical protein